MNKVWQIGDRSITAPEVVALLAGYQMLPQLAREIIIDGAIANINCTVEETAIACEQFYQQNHLLSAAARQQWQELYDITPEQLVGFATRSLRIAKFKQVTWGDKLETYFLSRKPQLDKAIFSLLRTKDVELGQELYFRILEGEFKFADLAREYSQGREAQTGGLNGPVELGSLHPVLARVLAASQPGQLWPPTRLDEWIAIVRLEKFIPAQLDENLSQRLLDELFSTWLDEKLRET